MSPKGAHLHGPEPVSTTHEMYLKVLYGLTESKPVGRVRDIARELGVTPGTVSLRLSKLQELGYVDQERYGGVLLTPAGRAIARCVLRRFETLRTLLVEVFGVDPETAEADACKMEHAISPITTSRMEALIRRLRAGQTLSREDLIRDDAPGRSGCEDCEALNVCGAALAVVADAGASRDRVERGNG